MRNDQLEIVADPISEARRYVENAREVLKERGKLNVEENRYENQRFRSAQKTVRLLREASAS